MTAPIPTPFTSSFRPSPAVAATMAASSTVAANLDPNEDVGAIESMLTYLAVLDGVVTDADENLLFARLESYLARGYRRLFIDAAEVVSGIGDLGPRLCRWGIANLDQFDEIHILTPTIASHNRLAITSLIMGPWLQTHIERPEFLAALGSYSRVADRRNA